MIRPLPLSLAFALIAACNNGPFNPTVSNVSGTYQATTLLLTDSTGPKDYLAIGSAITLQLDPAGTVTGHLFIVGGTDEGTDMDADMVGTWAISGDSVTFDQAADTFVRDWVFNAHFGRLTTDHSGGGVTVNVVMTKES